MMTISVTYYYISEGKNNISSGTVSERVLAAMYSNPNIIILTVITK